MGCFINEKSSVRRTQLCKYKTIILIEADYKKYLSLTRIMKFFFLYSFSYATIFIEMMWISAIITKSFYWEISFESVSVLPLVWSHEHDNIVNFVSIWHIHWSLMWSSIKNELKWKELVFHWSGFLAVLMICTIFFSL